jgi:hypothetical protein
MRVVRLKTKRPAQWHILEPFFSGWESLLLRSVVLSGDWYTVRLVMFNMDFSSLQIEDFQIRLITLQPVPAGADPATAPIKCNMTVRKRPLPADATCPGSDTFVLPPHYISFDEYVTEPPQEKHIEELRQELAPALMSLEKRKTNWVSRTTDKLQEKLFHQTQERVLTIPTHRITGMLSKY